MGNKSTSNPPRMQLTHNCCLKLVVVILSSTNLHLHKGTRNTSSKFGEMASPENLGHQRSVLEVLPSRELSLGAGVRPEEVQAA